MASGGKETWSRHGGICAQWTAPKLALAWVATGFLYELSVILKWEEVRLLARVGGWVEQKDNPPGKIVLTRRLSRLMDMLITQASLDHYRESIQPCSLVSHSG